MALTCKNCGRDFLSGERVCVNCLQVVEKRFKRKFSKPILYGANSVNELFSDKSNMLLQLAWEVYLKRKKENLEKVRDLLEQALLVNNSNPYIHILFGYTFMDEEDYVTMDEHFFRALDLAENPYEPGIWDGIILALGDGLNDESRLETFYNRAIEKKPDNLSLRSLIKIKLKKKQYEEANEILINFLTIVPGDKKAIKLLKNVEKEINKNSLPLS